MKKSKFSTPAMKIEEFDFPKSHLPPLAIHKSRKILTNSSKKHLKASSYGMAKTELTHNAHNDLADNTINNISYITPRIREKSFGNFQKRAVRSPLRRLNEFKKKKKMEDSINITFNTSENYSNLNTSVEKTKLFLRERNAEKILEQLIENISHAIKLNSIEILTDTFFLIGDLHLCQGSMEKAIFSYFHMKIICDHSRNFKKKLEALFAIANCCKIVKKFDYAITIYKKALEYVWLLKEEEFEAKIYDSIGMIYFLCGDISNAKYYHDRSLEYMLESDESPSKYSSSKSLNKFHEQLKFIHTTNINNALLLKLGISCENKNDGEIKIKFINSHISVNSAFENIFMEKDFSHEIPSPRYPRSGYKADFKLPAIASKSLDQRNNNAFDAQKVALKNEANIKPRKPQIKIDLDPMNMKIPVADKIKLRMILVKFLKEKSTNAAEQLRSKLRNQNAEALGFGIFYNHLTPNRSLEGYNYFYKNPVKKLAKYYEDMKKEDESFILMQDKVLKGSKNLITEQDDEYKMK